MAENDFLPTASLETLAKRAEIIQRLRTFFEEKGFLEVETPILSHDTVIDHHLHPIHVARTSIESEHPVFDSSPPLWLQTSPEFGMKRLLAAGATAIFQITKSFRAAESGRFHNPEFTMLEWYRVGDDQEAGINLLAELVQSILKTGPVERLSYRELFHRHTKVDPYEAALHELQQVCFAHAVEIEQPDLDEQHRDFWLDMMLMQVIEPKLGRDGPVIVYDWPASQSALAIVREGEPPLAERFELFIDGLEIANGYHELLDPSELRWRNRTNNQLRLQDGCLTLPEESRLLDAMEHGLPACAGVALGVDRLVMLATGAKTIKEVIAFPFDRA